MSAVQDILPGVSSGLPPGQLSGDYHHTGYQRLTHHMSTPTWETTGQGTLVKAPLLIRHLQVMSPMQSSPPCRRCRRTIFSFGERVRERCLMTQCSSGEGCSISSTPSHSVSPPRPKLHLPVSTPHLHPPLGRPWHIHCPATRSTTCLNTNAAYKNTVPCSVRGWWSLTPPPPLECPDSGTDPQVPPPMPPRVATAQPPPLQQLPQQIPPPLYPPLLRPSLVGPSVANNNQPLTQVTNIKHLKLNVQPVGFIKVY